MLKQTEKTQEVSLLMFIFYFLFWRQLSMYSFTTIQNCLYCTVYIVFIYILVLFIFFYLLFFVRKFVFCQQSGICLTSVASTSWSFCTFSPILSLPHPRKNPLNSVFFYISNFIWECRRAFFVPEFTRPLRELGEICPTPSLSPFLRQLTVSVNKKILLYKTFV